MKQLFITFILLGATLPVFAFDLEDQNIHLVCDGKSTTYQDISASVNSYAGQLVILKNQEASFLRDNLKSKKTKSHKEDGIQWWLYEFSQKEGETLASFLISEDDSAVKPLTFTKGRLESCWVSTSDLI